VTPDRPGRYSLQIGAFREAKNSEKAIQELQTKGYEPYVIEQKGRSILQTVRIGRYADRAEALRAASDFRRREGLEAIVRPIGS
jgi:cell division septation protein DedD